MTKAEITGIAPFFIVKNVPAALSFYRDSLGFDIVIQGPSDNDIFFGIVKRGTAMIILKDIGVDPIPNNTRYQKRHCPLGRLPSCSRSRCPGSRILVT